MENDFYSQFKKAKESIRLTADEKNLHRTQILKAMSLSPRKRIPTPYFFYFQKYFLVGTLSVFLIFAVGLTISSAHALPNGYLYSVKRKVVEPIAYFLTPDSERANFEVALVDRRLKEFSKIALQDKLGFEGSVAFKEEFSLQVKEAQHEILELMEGRRTPDAVEAVNDLKAVLEANDELLKKIGTQNTQEEIDQFSKDIVASLDSTDEIADSITDKINLPEEKTNLEESLNEQETELRVSLERVEVKLDGLRKTEQEFQTLGIVFEKESPFALELDFLNDLFEEALEKKGAGYSAEAFRILNQVNHRIGKMELLLNAEEELGLDILREFSQEEVPEDKEKGAHDLENQLN